MSDYVSARLDALLAAQEPPPEAPGGTHHGNADAEDPGTTPPPKRSSERRAIPTSVSLTLPALQRRHLPVIAGLVALALLLSGYAILHARAEQVPLVAASEPAAVPSATAASASATGGSTPAPKLQVHVIGAVKRPGVVRVAAGSRVHDVIAAAGGLKRGARTGRLNLAQVVSDGAQVLIDGDRSAIGDSAAAGGDAGGGDAGGSAGQPVDLNTATQAQLEELPGVGPVMAGNIVRWRQEHGRFTRVEELQEVDGVGPKTYARLAPLLRV